MPVDLQDLGVMNYLRGQTHWGYRTTNTRREIEHPSYFTDAGGMLKPGDFLFIHHWGLGREGNSIYCVVASGDAVRVKQMTWVSHRAQPGAEEPHA